MGKKGVRLWMERGDGADDVGREGVGDWEERAIFPGFGRFFGVWADVFTAPGGAFGVSQCAWGSGGHDVSMGAGGLGTSVEGRGQARRSPWPQAGHVRKARWRSLRSSASSGSVGESGELLCGREGRPLTGEQGEQEDRDYGEGGRDAVWLKKRTASREFTLPEAVRPKWRILTKPPGRT